MTIKQQEYFDKHYVPGAEFMYYFEGVLYETLQEAQDAVIDRSNVYKEYNDGYGFVTDCANDGVVCIAVVNEDGDFVANCINCYHDENGNVQFSEN